MLSFKKAYCIHKYLFIVMPTLEIVFSKPRNQKQKKSHVIIKALFVFKIQSREVLCETC